MTAAPDFNQLRLGRHPLPVPWEDNAVQLNVVVQNGISIGPLLVMVEESVIGFRREDDREFQIHDNARPVGSPEQRGRAEVLERAVSSLALERSVASGGILLPEGEGPSVINFSGWQTFLGFIFWGVYQQQNPDKTIAEINKIFDEQPNL